MTARTARPHPNLAGIAPCMGGGTSSSRKSQSGVPPFLPSCRGEFLGDRAPPHRHSEERAPAMHRPQSSQYSLTHYIMKPAFHRKILVVLGLALTQMGHAYELYTDLESWEAAAGATMVLEPFDTAITQNDRITFSCGIVSEGFDPVSSPFNYVSAGEWHATTRPTGNDVLVGYERIVWTFPTPVTAVAADWNSLGMTHLLTLTAGFDGNVNVSLLLREEIGGSEGFLGVVGSSPFTTLTLSQPAEANLNEGFRVDNVRFQPQAAPAIPEPSTSTLAVFATALLFLGRRKRATRGSTKARRTPRSP